MTFRIIFKVIAGNDFGEAIALRKNYTDAFTTCCAALHRKGWAWSVTLICFIEVDDTFFHDLPNFLVVNVPASHAAYRMFSINN
ncbi:MAG: hypothetical protein JWR72_864 [Flavisolibacter sp.]|nr:hypothetical protein [Flavisolibacter sp.]